jgi:hypothetical protein
MNQYTEEALHRAVSGDSMLNYQVIIAGMMSKGIEPQDIKPRINVLTLRAWNAKGRKVKKGEKGVNCITWIVCDDKEGGTYKRMKSVSVFHISQTELMKGN